MLDTPITNVKFAAIDFESAGSACGKNDAPIQVGITTWSLRSGILETWMSYIRTDEQITWAAQKLHGINKTDLAKAPKLAQLWPQLKSLLSNKAVVAHGHGTEKRFLRAFPGHSFSPWVDTLTLARKAWPKLPSHSLGEICRSLGIDTKVTQLVPNKSWHDALFDASASILLLEKLIEDHAIANYPLATLT